MPDGNNTELVDLERQKVEAIKSLGEYVGCNFVLLTASLMRFPYSILARYAFNLLVILLLIIAYLIYNTGIDIMASVNRVTKQCDADYVQCLGKESIIKYVCILLYGLKEKNNLDCTVVNYYGDHY